MKIEFILNYSLLWKNEINIKQVVGLGIVFVLVVVVTETKYSISIIWEYNKNILKLLQHKTF